MFTTIRQGERAAVWDRAGRLAAQQAENGAQEAFYQGSAKLNVDVTRYLVAQYQHPDRIIRVDGAPAAAVHLNPV